MNYRHAFHAGNFADVFKHAVLARIIAYLKQKPAAFRVIDTHAGAGLYDLAGADASRTGEWRDGIGKLLAAAPPPAVRDLLAPYLEAVASFNSGGAITLYPGSPALVRHWLRTQDRLIVCEAEPVAARALANRMRGDHRRGLVLTDPPFEQPDEFARIADGLAGAHRKWPTGHYLVWYPIKDTRAAEGFARDLTRRGIARMLRAELTVAPVRLGEKLNGSGLIIVNPPWPLEDELTVLLPALADVLAVGKGGTRLDWLAGEK
jgi:23S rRNA (adenine2030-N6)-methyltransferase